MGFISIILLIIAIAMIAAVALLMFSPQRKEEKKEGSTIIEVDSKQTIKIEPTADGNVRLQLLYDYDSWEDRPGDEEMFPDIQDTSVSYTGGDLKFWDKVASFSELDADERERIATILAEKGFIHKDKIGEYVFVNDGAPQPAQDAPAQPAAAPASAPVPVQDEAPAPQEHQAPTPFTFDGPDDFNPDAMTREEIENISR